MASASIVWCSLGSAAGSAAGRIRTAPSSSGQRVCSLAPEAMTRIPMSGEGSLDWAVSISLMAASAVSSSPRSSERRFSRALALSCAFSADWRAPSRMASLSALAITTILSPSSREERNISSAWRRESEMSRLASCSASALINKASSRASVIMASATASAW